MAEQLVAHGTKENIDDIGKYEETLKEGDEAIVTLNLSWDIGSWAADAIDAGARAARIPLTRKVEYSGSSPARIRIYWRKGFAHWVALAVVIASVAFIVWLAITTWQLNKVVPGLGTTWMTILPIAIIGLIAYLILTKKVPI